MKKNLSTILLPALILAIVIILLAIFVFSITRIKELNWGKLFNLIFWGLILSIIAFLFFATWVIGNGVLLFGHTIQCIQIYEIFSSGCSIL